MAAQLFGWGLNGDLILGVLFRWQLANRNSRPVEQNGLRYFRGSSQRQELFI